MTPGMQALISQQAIAQGVPPALASAVAEQESGGDQSAIGSSGEVGVFQLLPSTAASINVDPYDLVQNIAGGVGYLSSMLSRYGGNYAAALAAYNAGPGTVDKALQAGSNWFSQLPASTQKYVSSIISSAGAPAVSALAGISDPMLIGLAAAAVLILFAIL